MWRVPDSAVATWNTAQAKWGLITFCIIGFLGFAIAFTLIIALIPLYLDNSAITFSFSPGKSTNLISSIDDGESFFLHYEAPADIHSSTTGDIVNTQEIQTNLNKVLGLNGQLLVESGRVQAGLQRRKRSVIFRRHKRGLLASILLKCKLKRNPNCPSDRCQKSVQQRFDRMLKRRSTVYNFPVRILNVQNGLVSFRYTAHLLGIFKKEPEGFPGQSTSLSFVAAKSGSFNEPSTWIDGIVPYGPCVITIPVGIQVVLARSDFELNVRQFNISGTLLLGSEIFNRFTFHHPTSMMINAGGSIHDRTTNHRIFFHSGTIVTVHTSGSFATSNTTIFSYNSSLDRSNFIQNFTISKNIVGPRTYAILLEGSIRVFNQITYVAVNSGDFLDSRTWLSSRVPSLEIQHGSMEIHAFVASGCRLLTRNLDGNLRVPFRSITVSKNSVIELGDSATESFNFDQSVNLIIEEGGQMIDRTLTKKLFLKHDSVLMIHRGGSFVGELTQIVTYLTIPTESNIIAHLSVNGILAGPFTCGITPKGAIKTFNHITVIAIRSGDFLSTTTWLGGLMPTYELTTIASRVDLYLESGCHLSTKNLDGNLFIALNSIIINKQSILELGSDTSMSFKFHHSTSIIINRDGKMIDRTKGHMIFLQRNSMITIYEGGSFTGENTSIFSYSSTNNIESVSANVSLTSSSSGPSTFGFMPSGLIKIFSRVTFIAIRSGDFLESTSWLGNRFPMTALDEFTSEANIFIASGCHLTTHSLNGNLKIQFHSWIISHNAIVELNTVDQNDFIFSHSINILVQNGGKIIDNTSSHQIFMKNESNIIIHSGGVFIGSTTVLHVFESLENRQHNQVKMTIETNRQGPVTFAMISMQTIEIFQQITYVAVRSGSFGRVDTWLGNLIPHSEIMDEDISISVYIAPGCSLETHDLYKITHIHFQQIIVAAEAKLIIGSDATRNFTFQATIHLLVLDGGSIVDQTLDHRIVLQKESLITIHRLGTFIGKQTLLLTDIKFEQKIDSRFDYIFDGIQNGPFTCGILDDGSFETFQSITYIAVRTGSFTQAITWLGKHVPRLQMNTIERIEQHLYVAPGCHLSTIDLNGHFQIPFRTITISRMAKFVIESSTVSVFKFHHSIHLIILDGGQIIDKTVEHKIFLTYETLITIHRGGSFVSNQTYLFSYNLTIIENVSYEKIAIDIDLQGPFTCAILPTGSIATFKSISTIAIHSGEFQTPSTWLMGFMPTVDLIVDEQKQSVFITDGCHITTVSLNGHFHYQLQTIIIGKNAILELGSSVTNNFTFHSAIGIIVKTGGILIDNTSHHQIIINEESIFIIHDGGSFIGRNTHVRHSKTYSISEESRSTIVIDSSTYGPVTYVILTNASVRTYHRVTTVAIRSGDITQTGVWVAGTSPTLSWFDQTISIDLQIESGCHLSTADLHGSFSMHIRSIVVNTGATLELGSQINNSFIFVHSTIIIVNNGGTIIDSTSTHTIFLQRETLLIVQQGGSFVGSNTVLKIIPSVSTIDEIFMNLTIETTTIGPFTCLALPDGSMKRLHDVTFIAIQSGDIHDRHVWIRGVTLTEIQKYEITQFNLYISSGCRVTTVSLNGVLDIHFKTIFISKNATLELGSSNTATFVFHHVTSIVIDNGATLIDSTTEHKIILKQESIFIIYTGGSFSGTHTTIYSYQDSWNEINLSSSVNFTMGSNVRGPFTFAILTTGTIKTFDLVTFIALRSGQFLDSSTWISGLVPGDNSINTNEYVQIYVHTGCQLTTDDLQGQFKIMVRSILVESGATLILGSSTVQFFTFHHRINLIIYDGGFLVDRTLNHEIFVKEETMIMIYDQGVFIGSQTNIYSYHTLSIKTHAIMNYTIHQNITGPFTCGILSNGIMKTFKRITVIAVRSGIFDNPNIWLGDITPKLARHNLVHEIDCFVADQCQLILTTIDGSFSDRITTITVSNRSALIIGSHDLSTFTFVQPLNFVIETGAMIIDETSQHEVYLRTGTTLIIHQSGSFISTNTKLYSYTMVSGQKEIISNFSVASNSVGPFTCGILPNGRIQTYDEITFIAIESGDISQSSVWLGGTIPNIVKCNIHIMDGCNLTTSSLHDTFNFEVQLINVDTGAILEIGDTKYDHFGFISPVNIIVQTGGVFVDRTLKNEIYFSRNSLFVVHKGARFIGRNTTIHVSYTTHGNRVDSFSYSLQSNMFGPFTCAMMPSGTVKFFDSVTLVVYQSGEFSEKETWLGDVTPFPSTIDWSNGIDVYISTGSQLTTTSLKGTLDIVVNKVTIAEDATLILGGSTVDDFTFRHPINLILLSRGQCYDNTVKHHIYIPSRSMIQVHREAIIKSSNTILFSYNLIQSQFNVISNTSIHDELMGPWTCACFSDGSMQQYNELTYIAIGSGDFFQPSVWLGNMVPSMEIAQKNDGINIYISSTSTISTESLEGSFKIQCNTITISEGAIFELGGSSADSFTFLFPVKIDVLSGGIIKDLTRSNQIFFGLASAITVDEGGSFIGSNTKISTFTSYPPELNIVTNYTVSTNSTTSFVFRDTVNDETDYLSKTRFNVIASGNFSSPDIWFGGIVPTAEAANEAKGFHLYISPGCHLSTIDLGETLNISFKTITIDHDAVLELGGLGIESFTFFYRTNLIILSGGVLIDQTERNHILFAPNSTILSYPNALLILSNSNISMHDQGSIVYQSNGSIIFDWTSAQSFTIFAHPLEGIRLFTVPTYLVIQSGDFFSPLTWFGGLVPKAGVSKLLGGIDIHVVQGSHLSMTGYNGFVNHWIKNLYVHTGAVVRLGFPYLPTAFIFQYPVHIHVFGQLYDVTSHSAGFYFPPSSTLEIDTDGQIVTQAPTRLSSYSYFPSNLIDVYYIGSAEASTLFGPYLIEVDDSGIISSISFVAN